MKLVNAFETVAILKFVSLPAIIVAYSSMQVNIFFELTYLSDIQNYLEQHIQIEDNSLQIFN